MNIPSRFLTLMTAGTIALGSWAGLGAWIGLVPPAAIADDDQSASSSVTNGKSEDQKRSDEKPYVAKTKRELQRSLTRIQYDVTQNEATEPAFRNLYWNNKKQGIYKCVVCERDLFESKTKYESGTGWPSFYAPVDEENVATRTDYRLFYSRTEVHCSRCKAHLGHVFDDGPKPTGLRYCMNSASLKFVEKSASGEQASQGKGDAAEEGN